MALLGTIGLRALAYSGALRHAAAELIQSYGFLTDRSASSMISFRMGAHASSVERHCMEHCSDRYRPAARPKKRQSRRLFAGMRWWPCLQHRRRPLRAPGHCLRGDLVTSLAQRRQRGGLPICLGLVSGSRSSELGGFHPNDSATHNAASGFVVSGFLTHCHRMHAVMSGHGPGSAKPRP